MNELPPGDIRIKSDKRIARWVGGALVLLIVFVVVRAFVENPRLEWSVFGEYFFNYRIIRGLATTLLLAVISEVIALVLGLVIGFGRVSQNPVARYTAAFIVWIFRGVPLIVLVLLIGNIALFVPEIVVGIPFTGIEFARWDTNDVIPIFWAGVIALSLHDAAYNAEIFRSGIISVPDGQRRAAQALGMTWWQIQARVVLPQAIPVMVPPAMNQFVTLLKSTALVSIIAVGDLLTEAQHISALNQYVIELLLVATTWYLIAVSVASGLSRLLDSKSEKVRHTL